MEENYPPKKKCRKIHHYCDRSQYGEIGWFARFRKQFHLCFCASCRAYSDKNSRLTQTLKKSELHTLNPYETQAIKQRLQQKPAD